MRPNFSFLECIMFTLNEVTLLGRLGSDAKVRTAANGKKYAMISLATEEVFRDDQGGWATTTVWHDLIVFPSDAVLQHLKKGACVLVKAAVSYRTEENSNRKLMNLKVRQLQVQASGGAITPKVIPVLIKETAITARKIRRMCSALNKRLSRDRFRMTISSDS